MCSSPRSVNASYQSVCNFDELESLRLESEHFLEEVQALGRQFRSHSYLHSLVNKISSRFSLLQNSWNHHCESAIDESESNRQQVLSALSEKTDELSTSRKRVDTLRAKEQEMEVKETVLHNTLKNITELMSADIAYVEQAIEGQKVIRSLQTFDQREMLQQVDGEMRDMLEMEEKEGFIQGEDMPRQLIPHPPAQPPVARRAFRPNNLRPRIQVDSDEGEEEELNLTEEFDKVMDALKLEQEQRPSNDFNMSMEKSIGGWDSALESGPESLEPSLSPEKLKSALMVLRKVHLLNEVTDIQNPVLIQQIEEVLNGPDVTQNLEHPTPPHPSDLACTTPKSFPPAEKPLEKTVLSTGSRLFLNEGQKQSDPSLGQISSEQDEEDNQEMQWEDLMAGNESVDPSLPVQGVDSHPAPVPVPHNTQKPEEIRMKEASGGSPRTIRFAQTYLSQHSRGGLKGKLNAPPLLDQEQSKFMYQLTKRSSTFSTKASSGLRSRILKGSGDMVLESPCYQPSKAFERELDSS